MKNVVKASPFCDHQTVAVAVMRLFWSLAVLLHVRYVQCEDFCRKTMVVNGANGDNVTLGLDEENIDDVTWIYNNKAIASTGPQKAINVTRTYWGKLACDQDGFLVIMNLREEDEGIYSASIRLRTGDMCTAHYQLHVYQKLSVHDIKIEHNVLSHRPCHVILTCTASGTNVTIIWNGSDISVTHKAVNVTDPKTRYTCTALNPISEASKSITSWEYCEKGNKSWIGVIISIAVITTIAVVLYIYHTRRRRGCGWATVVRDQT
ncbi:SLAM family member 5-like isoform X2 [Eleutherodactylus coqui]|uniref:SLAM family member 5-like isoform X2 n=1 Tax=Eleutherodactylus coqui TaxID=57060 RepID=UPI00346380F2